MKQVFKGAGDAILFPLLLALFLIATCALRANEQPTARYLPVVVVHGILGDEHSMEPTIAYIEKYMPGTYVRNANIGSGFTTSFWNMFSQLGWLVSEIKNDPALANGFNMIAHSQGGLIARAYVELYNSPAVYNLITWGSPHMGVFGTPGAYDNRFTWINYSETIMYQMFYTNYWQNFVSIANYWRDTINYGRYLEKCTFLPYLNNELEHEHAELYKNNLCALTHLVLVQSQADDIIEPLESCHFGFYKIGSASAIQLLLENDWYLQDKLGLKTLNESGRLHLLTAHCTHTDYQTDEDNFVKNTLPFLTASIEQPVVAQPAAVL